jgi:hypothetical protein
VLVVELEPGKFTASWTQELIERASLHGHTRSIRHFLPHPRLPVDVRHNAKINRDELAAWAAKQLCRRPGQPPAASP